MLVIQSFFKTLKGEIREIDKILMCKIHIQLWIVFLLLHGVGLSQVSYNHPEIDWHTFETEHFYIHFYDETERTAREGATVAESVYPHVTKVYDYELPTKTHLIFLDTDDFSNGAAYYYDNKIEIWASPMDFELRGSHRWLQNVITHEFTHIVSLQKAMKFGKNIPGGYLQWIQYEDEKREDVLYGYPYTLVSYPIPGTTVPPWLAEGTAQYMYEKATHDFWDTHRDMILRDRVLNNNLLSFTEMNTFGKKGIGNESTYNAGFALARYIALKYGEDTLRKIMVSLSNSLHYSINKAIRDATGLSGIQIYNDFKVSLEEQYKSSTEIIGSHKQQGKILIEKGTTNIHPVWAPNGNRFAYLSNAGNDFFSQTDLYIYSLESKNSEKIVAGVFSAPSWKSTGDVIYYSKKSKPDFHGSKWFDIYSYSFDDKDETQLTEGARAISPILLPGDSLLAYIAVNDGTHNVFMINLNTERSERITDFDDGKQLFSLTYDEVNNSLICDFVENHFRNTAMLNLSYTTFTHYIATEDWDERDITITPGRGVIYSVDKSGIFNLFFLDTQTGNQRYITNVIGGAFMPDVSRDGKILYSLYENGGYKIALLESMEFIEEQKVGYNPDYYQKFQELPEPITQQDTTQSQSYTDSFSPMFVFPKLMMDYGMMKPGIYFYSSEILNKLNIFGGASLNRVFDTDLFLLFEYRKFYPTVFTEIFYLIRNVSEKTQWVVYDQEYDIKFRLFQWDAGIKVPIQGNHELKIYGSYQNFREAIKLYSEEGMGKIGFDYYIGKHAGIEWYSEIHKPAVDFDINPGNGLSFDTDIRFESNRFFDGFKINEDYSTPQAIYLRYKFFRVSSLGEIHFTIPKTERWTVTVGIQGGWLSETKVDSFFNFFAGGMPGLRGYPFYSIEGNRLAITSFSFRIPLMQQKHFAIGPFILQNIVIGAIGQFGDAWSGSLDNFKGKRSAGIQIRFGGFSFYNYPTGIAVEVHKGLDKFSIGKNAYGEDFKTYFTLMFGF